MDSSPPGSSVHGKNTGVGSHALLLPNLGIIPESPTLAGEFFPIWVNREALEMMLAVGSFHKFPFSYWGHFLLFLVWREFRMILLKILILNIWIHKGSWFFLPLIYFPILRPVFYFFFPSLGLIFRKLNIYMIYSPNPCISSHIYVYANICTKLMPKNAQTSAQLHTAHTLVK